MKSRFKFRTLNSGPEKRGFTLIELLIVIGIIAVLMAIAVVAINPARQFAKANDARRQSDVRAILDAIQYNIIDNKGVFLCAGGDIPTTESVIRSSTTTFPPSAETSGMPFYDLCANCLVPEYFGTMPIDPQKGGWESCANYNTEYTIQKTASITIRAPHAQLGEKIETTLPGVITVKVPAGVPDTTPPIVGTTSPTSAAVNVAADFSASVSDNIAVTSCNLFVNGVDQGSMNLSASPCTNCTVLKSYTFTLAGTFPMYARCSDAAGNTTSGSSVNVTVSSAPTPDFSISASPTSLTGPQTSGASDPSTTITVNSLNGFSSPVTLSTRWCTGPSDTTCSQSKPASITPAFSVNPVTPTGNSTLSLDTNNTPAGTYYFRTRGTSGSLTHDTGVITLTVVDLSVALTANPSSGNAPLNGVDLTADVGGSSTGTVNFKFHCNASTPPATWEHSFDTINVTVTDAVPVNRTDLQGHSHSTQILAGEVFTVYDICNYASAATYTPRVMIERGGSVQNTTTVTVSAAPDPDFSISISPASRTINVGDSTTYTFTVASINGFNGTVNLYASLYDNSTDEQNDYNNHYNWNCVGELCNCNKADVNRSGNVDITDVLSLNPYQNQTCSTTYPQQNSVERYRCNRADVNRNGTVDVSDSNAISPYLNRTCSQYYKDITLSLSSGTIPGGSGSATLTVSSLATTSAGTLYVRATGVYTAAELANGPERSTASTLTVNALAQGVWRYCENGTLNCTLNAAYALGYKFTPTLNGRVTQLCGRFSGTNQTVRLYNSSYATLAQTSISSSNTWVCNSISPVDVFAGSVYYVVVEPGTGNRCRDENLSPTLPQTCNLVTVNAGVVDITSPFDGNHAELNDMVYGLVDITFSPNP